MLATAQSFEASSGRMRDAHSSLKAAMSELSAAWKGAGSEQYETLRETLDAHCSKMTEMAAVEAGNIRSASTAYVEADAVAAGIVGGAGR